MKRVRSNLILMRLIIIFLFIVLPVAFVGVFFISRSISLQDELISNVIQQNLTMEVTHIDEQMKTIQNALFYLAEEDDISILSSRPEDFSKYECAKAINSLQRRLYTLHMSSSHVNRISVTIPAISIAIHSLGFTNLPAIETMSDEKIMQTATRFEQQQSRFVVDRGDISYFYQLPALSSVMDGKVPRLMFEVDYDVQSLGKVISSTLPDSGVRYAMLNDTGSVLITNECDAALQKVISTLFIEESPHLSNSRVCTLRVSGQPFYVLMIPIETLDTSLLIYVPLDGPLGPSMDLRIWIYSIIGFIALAVVLYSWFAYSRVQTPIFLLLSGFNRLEQGNLDFQIAYSPRDEFQLLVQRFNRMLLRLKNTLSQLYDQKIMTQQAEMKHLQAQINPHFLYNNFYILDNMLLMEDFDTASRFCRLLGAYFQYVTKSSQLYAPLDQEIMHAKTYVEIQATRFGSSLSVSFEELPKGLANPMVPRIILQPILENAFKHALEGYDGQKALRIYFSQDDSHIIIFVENNGPVLSCEEVKSIQQSLEHPASSNDSTGLKNVHQRLKISHGTGILLKARPNGGMIVKVLLSKGGIQNAV